MGTFDLMKLSQEADPEVWVTKDRRHIPISELGDRHLLNIIKMLRRASRHYVSGRVNAYLRGPYPRGEMAQMAWEHELMWWDGSSSWDTQEPPPEDVVFDELPWTPALMRELERRGLKED